MIETITNPKSKVFKQKRYHEQRKRSHTKSLYGGISDENKEKKEMFFLPKKNLKGLAHLSGGWAWSSAPTHGFVAIYARAAIA